MVKVTLTYRDDGAIISCKISGHAGYDDPGYDIVCAAVSVLACTAVLGLEQVAQQEGIYEAEAGHCLIQLMGDITEKGQTILRTMVLGLEEIGRQYSEFVKIQK